MHEEELTVVAIFALDLIIGFLIYSGPQWGLLFQIIKEVE